MNPFDEMIVRLKTNGWFKGEYGPAQGPNCLIGAEIACRAQRLGVDWDTARIGWTGREELVLLDEVIREQYFDESSIVDFNDNPDTTFDDVIAILEKASVRWNERV